MRLILRFLLLLIILLLIKLTAPAQSNDLINIPACGTTDYSNAENLNFKNFKKSNTDDIYHIPVVFHVFHSSNPEQFTESKAESIIAMLNQDFNAENPNLNGVQAIFQNIIGDISFKFHLAKIDNKGSASNGITYTKEYIPGDNPGCNSTLKIRKNWNSGDDWTGQQKYLQIWVTTNVNGESNGSGWSYLPESDGGGKMAGVVYNLKYLGDGSDYMHHVLTHEIGHYFGLNHTFGPSYDACGDDGIDDTPITRCYIFECRTGDLCGDGKVNVENFMDYTTCACMFTEGQNDLMHYWVEHNYRNALWSEENLKATGIWTEITNNKIIETEINNIKIFPNPTNGIIKLEGLNDCDKTAIQVYTINGSLIRKIQITGNQINLSDLGNGIYILEIKRDKETINRQIQILK